MIICDVGSSFARSVVADSLRREGLLFQAMQAYQQEIRQAPQNSSQAIYDLTTAIALLSPVVSCQADAGDN